MTRQIKRNMPHGALSSDPSMWEYLKNFHDIMYRASGIIPLLILIIVFMIILECLGDILEELISCSSERDAYRSLGQCGRKAEHWMRVLGSSSEPKHNLHRPLSWNCILVSSHLATTTVLPILMINKQYSPSFSWIQYFQQHSLAWATSMLGHD